jgi:hypothetical protein
MVSAKGYASRMSSGKEKSPPKQTMMERDYDNTSDNSDMSDDNESDYGSIMHTKLSKKKKNRHSSSEPVDLRSVRGGINWKGVDDCIEQNDLNSAYSHVLDFGTLEHLNKLMEKTGPQLEVCLTVACQSYLSLSNCVMRIFNFD